MDATAHYRHLLTLGREEFLGSAAPAVFIRYRFVRRDLSVTGTKTVTFDHDHGETMDQEGQGSRFTLEPSEIELYPLAKKPGASFPDRITIGRTVNNDVVIAEPSVSRLHAYVRQVNGWVVADAGSKNGSWLGDEHLEPRREAALLPRAVIRFGDVQLTFYQSSDLFDLLGGDHDRR